MGALAVATFQVAWILAVLINGPSIATIIQCNAPIIVTLIARIIWGESLTWQKWTAIGLASLGTILIAWPTDTGAMQITMTGFLISMGSAFSYAGITLFTKKLARDYSSWTILAFAFGFAALALLPFQFGYGQSSASAPDRRSIAGMSRAAYIRRLRADYHHWRLCAVCDRASTAAGLCSLYRSHGRGAVSPPHSGTCSSAIVSASSRYWVRSASWAALHCSRYDRSAQHLMCGSLASDERMANKEKGIAKTMPVRVLAERGIPCHAHQQSHKQVTSAGVAEDLGVPVAQVVRAMIVQRSIRFPGYGEFVVAVIPGDRN